MSRLSLAMLSVLVIFVVPAASYDKLNPKDADVDSKAVERNPSRTPDINTLNRGYSTGPRT